MGNDSDGRNREQNELTRLLDDVNAGDHSAGERLLPLVYDQLRAIAGERMRAEDPAHTLQATALVHEAYLRLVGQRRIPWENQAHFFRAAADAMRWILIDHAKAKGRQKRGGNRKRNPLNVLDLAVSENSQQILALDDAIRRLEQQEPEAAEVVRLRFFAGLSVDDTAEALGLSPRTVDRRWHFARAWLFREMQD